jgi:hypothetical protein
LRSKSLFFWMNFPYQLFLSCSLVSKKLLSHPGSPGCSPRLSSRSLTDLQFTFQSLIHLGLWAHFWGRRRSLSRVIVVLAPSVENCLCSTPFLISQRLYVVFVSACLASNSHVNLCLIYTWAGFLERKLLEQGIGILLLLRAIERQIVLQNSNFSGHRGRKCPFSKPCHQNVTIKESWWVWRLSSF